MCQNPEEGRRAVWGYTFDEILEIIQLLRWTNRQTNSQVCSEETVDALFGKRPVSQAVAHHLQQLLPVKIESIFGKRGGGFDEEGKEVSENKLLGCRWWKPMRNFADGAIDDAQSLRELWNRLEDDRHRLIAHREGKTADVTHERNANQRSIKFKANPDPFKGEELEALQTYFQACKFFCEHARDTKSGPTLPQFAQQAWHNA
ncbi:hypothetical protein [Phaeobacter sp. S60]|uniref:hypothetical protein n=1 Tax=Phaeobacter sp. S60 TaxID=1569353 RepID=UPI00058C0374|nr:hypothetical protein [Phaeobacter sp. S60]KII12568.1 hypothetical protein OO25_16880 [Phaeobacter sp. S60]